MSWDRAVAIGLLVVGASVQWALGDIRDAIYLVLWTIPLLMAWFIDAFDL